MPAQWQDPIVRLLAEDGGVVGTGVLVQTPQYGLSVLTAAHVVNEVFAPRRLPYTPDKPGAKDLVPFELPMQRGSGPHLARVIEWLAPKPPEQRAEGRVTDVALLQVVANEKVPAPMDVGALEPEDFEGVADDRIEGRSIRCFGFPDRAGEGRHARGQIQGWGSTGLIHLVATDDRGHFITPGFSGAPIFDQRGQKVLAMAVSMDADPQKRLALAAPTRLLWRACPGLAQPYRGLKVFDEGDMEFFFGRETFTAALLEKAAKHKIFGVTAGSGAGKSSAIRAGLLPRLKTNLGAVVLVMRPYDDPWKQLAAALEPRLFPGAPPGERPGRVRTKAAELRANPSVLWDDTTTILEMAPATRLLIFIDQLEELFTIAEGHEPAAGAPASVGQASTDFCDFMVATAHLGRRAGVPKLQWLYALRGDFADRAFRHPAFRDAVGQGNEFLADMRPAELRDAIEKPAAALDVLFEGGTSTQPGLVERIARDAGARDGSLPLMQHVLEELWDRMCERRLTHEAYEAMGQLSGALDRHAETVFAALNAEEQRLTPRLFARLIKLDESGEATRRMVRRVDVDPAFWALAVQLATEVERDDSDPVKSRLLAVNGVLKAKSAPARAAVASTTLASPVGTETGASDEAVEVAHEALLRHWGRLREWISEQKDFLLWRNRLDRRIAELDDYIASGAPPSVDDVPAEYLLRGRHLVEARSWLASRFDDLDAKQVSFLNQSVDAAEREEQRLARERQEKAEAAREQDELKAQLQRAEQALAQYEQASLFKYGYIEVERLLGGGSPAPPEPDALEVSPNWAIQAIKADQSPFTGHGVTVGCIDTGIDESHPTFVGLEIFQRDFSGEGNGDRDGHGTAMASLMLGRPVEGRRIGVAPGVNKLLSAKIGSTGRSDALVAALLWLRDSGVHIIHIGFGFDFLQMGRFFQQMGMNEQQALARVLQAHRETAQLLEVVMSLLHQDHLRSGVHQDHLRSGVHQDHLRSGVLVFAPAGNESNGPDRVPVTSPIANAEGVISVGCVGRAVDGLTAAPFTNLNPTICAPGVDVPVAKAGGGLSTMSGTAPACALAVGTAALWWESLQSRVGAADWRRVTNSMIASATKSGFAPGTDEKLLGSGMILAPSVSGKPAAPDNGAMIKQSDPGVLVAPSVPISVR